MTNRNRIRLSQLSVGLAIALAAAPAFAQQTSASVGGRIVTADAAPVAGAQVSIVHTPSGTVSTAVTGADGRYVARGLRVGGPYTVTIVKDGVTEVREGVYLQLAETTAVDATLGQGATTLEAVEVTGTAVLSEVFSASKMGAGTGITEAQMQELPSVNRNIQDYVRLDPRVAQTDKGRGEISAGGQNPRYNAIRIDGVNTSDTFGLESNNSPVQRQPVSMDAIEEVRVDLSNYDTTITGATGAVIDAVTKSGTNEFHGSAYYVYRDQDWVRENTNGTPFAGFTDEETIGATFGGPLVKDTLFFFVNYEKFTRNRPAATFGPPGSGASNIVNIDPADILLAQQIAQDVYGIDIGSLETPSGVVEEIEEAAIKLDWNIVEGHRASLRYSTLDQVTPVLAGSSGSSLGLNSRYYNIVKTFDSTVLQVFSDWSDNFSTEFKVSQREYESISDVASRLPQMSIGFGTTAVDEDEPSSPFLNFGADEFRHGNEVRTDTVNAFAAGNLFVGDHELKFGFDWDSNDVYNLFAQNVWGSYTFASLEHFERGEYWQYRLNAPVPGRDFDSIAMRYTHDNLGLFVQDTWSVNYNLTLMFGMRFDTPNLDEVDTHNLLVQEVFGEDNRHTLDGNSLFEPRAGFNYTFDTDRPTQLRGGVGLFQGAAANVWVGNSYQNTGFGLIGYNSQLTTSMTQEEREAIWATLPFNPDPDNPTTPSPASGYQMNVNLMDEGMEQPSVYKANLAFEHELPWFGTVFSAEALVTRVNKGLLFERLDLGAPNAVRGQDGRLMYWGNAYTRSGVRANGNAELLALIAAGEMPAGYENVTGWHNDGVIKLKNTGKGGSEQFTVSLSKPMTDAWSWMLAYTYTNATEVNPLTSSRAISNWNGRMVFDPNEDVASTSNYEIKDRVIGTLNWEHAFFGNYKTRAGLFYEGRSGRPYSWTFANDANGDGYVNDLFYVPSAPGDVIFRTAAQEAAFFAFMGDNPGLASYAGEVVDRNSMRSSWVNTFDLRISQELPGFFKGHNSELWLDVMNVGNLLNEDWGRIEEIGFPQSRRVASLDGIDPVTGRYRYNFTGPDSEVLYDTTGQSRWGLQLGFRYRF